MLIPFKELWQRHNVKTSCILHLGASMGQEAPAYAELGVGSVIWVEAIPEIFRALTATTRRYPGHRALQACLSDTDGTVVNFHIANNQAQSSSFLQFGTHAQAHPTVKFVRSIPMRTVRCDTLLQTHKISIPKGSFLNVDLQGAELLAMRGLGEVMKSFDYAYIEINKEELYKDCPLVGEIDAFLQQYQLVGREEKMTGAGWGDKFYSKL